MKNKTLRFIVIFILSGLAFFAVTMPTRDILSVFTVSEVRPAAALNPFLGISFGFPAALGIAVANTIADGLSGYSPAVLIEGFIPQFLYTYVPYIVWKKLTKEEDHIHRLDSISRVLKYTAAVFSSAILSAVGVGMIIYVNFGVNPFTSGFFVFLNNFDIGIMLGFPLMILSNQIISRRSGTKRIISTNEKIILSAFAIECIVLAIMIPVVYHNGMALSVYDIWTSIYYYSVVIINVLMMLSLAVICVVSEKE